MSAAARGLSCAGCGATLDPAFLECPVCHRLTRSAELTRLAGVAQRAEETGDLTAALTAWREAVALLPPGTAQRRTIDAEMRRLSAVVDRRAPNAGGGGAAGGEKTGKKAGALAGLGAVGAAVLANAKLLLVGLLKLPTLLSMVGYAYFMGGRGLGLSLGIIAAIYVHEVGHVAALRRYGIAASAPMFVPGFGALVRMKQYPTDAHEEARTGLAGPLWGLFASVVALVLGALLHSTTALEVASWSATINAFNLIPVWQLDGARGLKALSRSQRWVVGGVALAAALVTREWMPGVVGAVVLGHAAFGEGHQEGDRGMLALFTALVVLHPAVSWLATALLPG